MFYFLLITSLLLLFIFFILITKEHKKSMVILYIGLFWTFVTPFYFFLFGGTTYKVFSDNSLNIYSIYSSIILIITILGIFFKQKLKNKLKKNLPIKKHNNKLVKVYFSTIVFITIGYICIYFNHFPIIHFFISGVLLDRADTSGHIPHFKSFTLFAYMLFPSIYFYYYNQLKEKVYLNFLIISIVSFILVIGGHKGVIVFFFLFCWIYIYSYKINLKIVFIFLFLLFVYIISKGISEVNADLFSYIMTSPLRRFFVTQGTGFIVRIDMLETNYILTFSEVIKQEVFHIIYNASYLGSHPTFFLGDILFKYGYFTSIIIYIFVLIFIILVSFYIENYYKNNLFIYWNWYNLLLLLCLAEVSWINFLTYIMLICNIIIVLFLKEIKIEKKY